MTDTNPTPENLAATLVEVSQQLEDLRGSTLDPTDPLNEVVSNGWTVRDPNKYEERDAFDTLQRWGAPRTLRNILKAYITNSDHSFASYENYTIGSPTTEASYRIHRLEACKVKSPDGREHDPVYRTKDFPLPRFTVLSSLVGWTFGKWSKVIDTFEDSHYKYIIVELS